MHARKMTEDQVKSAHALSASQNAAAARGAGAAHVNVRGGAKPEDGQDDMLLNASDQKVRHLNPHKP